MINKLKILTAVLVSCMSLSVVNVAVAGNANSNLCNLTFKSLKHEGFFEHAAYKAADIQELLRKVGVIVNLSHWDPNQLYSLSYSCRMAHGVTYPSLIATIANMPSNEPAAIPGVIIWDATPPTSS